jgi:hypothetical protein
MISLHKNLEFIYIKKKEKNNNNLKKKSEAEFPAFEKSNQCNK